MKKILLYTFIAAASTLTTSCNDYWIVNLSLPSALMFIFILKQTWLLTLLNFTMTVKTKIMENMAIFSHPMVLLLII